MIRTIVNWHLYWPPRVPWETTKSYADLRFRVRKSYTELNAKGLQS